MVTLDINNHYIERINLVLNHIRTHLADDLSLDSLAQIAGFSPFHFHRIFKDQTGETLNQCTTRLRLERSVALLRSTPDLSISAAADESGFTSLAVFSRAFKKQYGINPQKWDRRTPLENRKNRKTLSAFPIYDETELRQIAESGIFNVYCYELPAQRIAYRRIFNSYQSGGELMRAYDQLIAWYQAEGGQLDRTTLYGISQDDPDTTPLELCRYDLCLSIPKDWHISDPAVSDGLLPTCMLAAIRVRGDIWLVDKAWQFLYRYWLPHSPFQPDNLPAMEIYRTQPLELGWEQYDIECAVPIARFGWL